METTQFLVVILACLVMVLPQCLAANEESQLLKYIQRKCDSSTAEQVKADARTLSAELDRAFAYIPDNLEHFCKNERPFLAQIASGTSQKFAKCVSGEEMYLPQFFNGSFAGFLHFLCHQYGENVRTLYSEEGQACMKQLRTQEAADNLDICFNTILGPSKNVVVKADLCGDLQTAKRCFSRIIDNRCPGATVLPKLNEHLFQDLSRPCRPSQQTHSGHHQKPHQNPNSADYPSVAILPLSLVVIICMVSGKYAS